MIKKKKKKTKRFFASFLILLMFLSVFTFPSSGEAKTKHSRGRATGTTKTYQYKSKKAKKSYKASNKSTRSGRTAKNKKITIKRAASKKKATPKKKQSFISRLWSSAKKKLSPRKKATPKKKASAKRAPARKKAVPKKKAVAKKKTAKRASKKAAPKKQNFFVSLWSNTKKTVNKAKTNAKNFLKSAVNRGKQVVKAVKKSITKVISRATKTVKAVVKRVTTSIKKVVKSAVNRGRQVIKTVKKVVNKAKAAVKAAVKRVVTSVKKVVKSAVNRGKQVVKSVKKFVSKAKAMAPVVIAAATAAATATLGIYIGNKRKKEKNNTKSKQIKGTDKVEVKWTAMNGLGQEFPLVYVNGKLDNAKTSDARWALNKIGWKNFKILAPKALAELLSINDFKTLLDPKSSLAENGMSLFSILLTFVPPAKAVKLLKSMKAAKMLEAGGDTLIDLEKISKSAGLTKKESKAFKDIYSSGKLSGKYAKKSVKSLPQNTKQAYNDYKAGRWSERLPGVSRNDGRIKPYKNSSDPKLPESNRKGDIITYKEYRVIYDDAKNEQRFVRGSDEKVYFSPDHYRSWVEVIE